LARVAQEAAKGRIMCFGRRTADYGDPVDWHLNPTNGYRWDPGKHWSRVLGDGGQVGDIKLTWEIGRFPHAFQIARAAALWPDLAATLTRALERQISAFVDQNPYGKGVHWASGQEIAFRLLAWLFAARAMTDHLLPETLAQVRKAVVDGAVHIARNLAYARYAVHNNHILSEALALYVIGGLFAASADGIKWRKLGSAVLEEQANRQFYADGGYIQLSHNYHRLALQDLLCACAAAQSTGETPAATWVDAMQRSLDFLLAQQNPEDGRLPNYGANDGALPFVLSTCKFSDFRPTLQAVSLATRGTRIYEPGPWDEEAAWLLGPMALDAPLERRDRVSVSFATTGFHVLRGEDPGTFALFRCGTIHDRFSQIDMLHLDVWWRGLNLLVDGGSYLYNGPREWHNHFMRTASHNTVTVDGLDQMLHHRPFKCLYWTRARLLSFEEAPTHVLCAGEHYGYERHPGRCVHQRSILMVNDGGWIVVDHILGEGAHLARLHWLGGDFPHEYSAEKGTLTLDTGFGPFEITVCDETGVCLPGDVARGIENPPRGWLSRHYGEKVAVPSLAVTHDGPVPLTMVTILAPANGCQAVVVGNRWEVGLGRRSVRFSLEQGLVTDVHVHPEALS